MKKIIKASKIDIIFLVISILIVGFIAYSFTHYGNAKVFDAPNEDPVITLDYSNINETYNCAIENDKLVTKGNDAYILYKLPTNNIKSFKLQFSQFPHYDISKYINVKYDNEWGIPSNSNIANLKDSNYLLYRTDNKQLNEIKIYLVDDLFVFKDIELFNNDLSTKTIYIKSSTWMQIAVYIAAMILIIVLWFINKKTKFFSKIINTILNNKKRILFIILYIIISIALAGIITRLISLCNKSAFNIYIMFFIACVIMAIITIFRIAKSKNIKIELIFVCISLIAGSAMILISPIGAIGLDMDSHIRWITGLSNADGYANQPEADIVINTTKFWPKENLEDNMESLNKINEGSDIVTSKFPRDIELPHIPGNISFCIARQFNLDFYTTYCLTRFLYLILYTMICYFAIKKLKSGKRIMTVIALFPQCLYLVTTVSYDWWVISFMLLGFSYFFYEKQQPDKSLKWSNTWIMCGSFFLACLPKQAYILCMFLPFLINKEEFKTNKKKRKIFYLFVFGSIALLTITLLIRTASTMSIGGDIRGGSNVNSVEQIKYILANPFDFANMLYGFTLSSISILSGINMITHFGYLGAGWGGDFLILLLIFVIITDKNKFDKASTTLISKLLIITGFIASVAFIAASFYIVFTQVGANTINGFQYRYIIPLLFPFAAIIGSWKIKNNINKIHYDLGISLTIFIVIFVEIAKTMLMKMV